MELTINELREWIAPTNEATTEPGFNLLDGYVGRNVFVRTVTHHYTGTLTTYDDKFLHLANAAWIADDGRFADALATGKLNEVEPFPGDVLVAVGALVDVSPWDHNLPRVQK